MQARERLGSELGDPDSRFATLEKLRVHIKAMAPRGAAAAQLGVHCYHGFGANLWSWGLVQQRLADGLSALVTSHDMPGFGLTSRPTDLSGYFLAFNGRLGRLILDYELAACGLLAAAALEREGRESFPHAELHEAPGGGAAEAAAAAGAAAGAAGAAGAAASAPKRVLMGHSLGSACAALEAINNPEGVAALVLVSPAILAMGGGVTGLQLQQLHDDSPLSRAHAGEHGGAAGDGAAAAEAVASAGSAAAGAGGAATVAGAVAATAGGAGVGGAAAVAAETSTAAGKGGKGAASAAATREIGGVRVATFEARGEAKVAGPKMGRAVGAVVGFLQSLVLAGVLAVLLLLRPLLLLGLRSAVRSKQFWVNTLKQAYYDPKKLDGK